MTASIPEEYGRLIRNKKIGDETRVSQTTAKTEIPMISVVTPTYNAKKTLVCTIESVQTQGYPSLEYIVVDGGSQDGTFDILRESSGISCWVSERDNGIYDAMNKGVRMAGGRWVGILNADDFYLDGVIMRVAELASRYPEVEVFYADLRMVYEDRPSRYLRSARRLVKSKFWRMPVWHPTMFVRSDVYRRMGDFAEGYRISGDYELVLRFFLSGVRFMHVREQWVEMRGGGASDMDWHVGKYEIEAIARKYGVYSGFLKVIFHLDIMKILLSIRIKKTPILNRLQLVYRQMKSKLKVGF